MSECLTYHFLISAPYSKDIPLIRGHGKWMQENFFSKSNKSSLTATTYEALTESLKQVMMNFTSDN